MKLNFTALAGDTWEGALLAQQAKDSLIEEQIALGNMIRINGKLVITLAGVNAYQEELDAEYASKVGESNNKRLLNSLTRFSRKKK